MRFIMHSSIIYFEENEHILNILVGTAILSNMLCYDELVEAHSIYIYSY